MRVAIALVSKGRCGVGWRTIGGNQAMTLYEMGTIVRNINHRAARIEQFLTTLATKEELRDGMSRLEARIEAVANERHTAIEETPAPLTPSDR
jgi:hypothetical protein